MALPPHRPQTEGGEQLQSNTELAFLLHDAGLNYGTEQVADGHKGIVRFQSAATLPANHVGKTEMAG